MHGEFQNAVRLLLRSAGPLAVLCLLLPAPARAVAELVPGGFVAEIIAAFVFPAAVIHILAARHAGRNVSVPEAVAGGLHRIGKLAVATLVSRAFVMLGTLALVIPGVVLAVRFMLINCAVMLEDRGPLDAIRRSDALTRGRGWDIFFVAAVIYGTCAIFTVGPTLALLDETYVPRMTTRWLLLSAEVFFATLIAEVLILGTMYFFYAAAVARERAAEAATVPPDTPARV